MKVVINKCYGGVGLSPKAVKRFCELEGRECYFFNQDNSTKKRKWIPVPLKEAQRTNGFHHIFDIPDPNTLEPKKSWEKMTEKERMDQNTLISKHYISQYSFDRCNKNLIRVVEELGKEANGQCSDLKIVEIPDGTQYEIDDYDGVESIHEVHQSWG